MTVYHDDMRVRDRREMPELCPECGGQVESYEIDGTFCVRGPDDRQAARKRHGVDARDGDTVKWRGLNGYCVHDDWVWMVAIA